MNTNSTQTVAANQNFFGLTYCTRCYGVRDGRICQMNEDGVTGTETILRSLEGTPEHIAAFNAIERRHGRGRIECFAAAEQYFTDNNATRARH